jgi:lycopene cyclase CruA
MVAASAKSRSAHPSPDLSDFRKRYPLTVASFGALGNREAWLRRIWEADARWQQMMSEQSKGSAAEHMVKGAPPSGLPVEAEFEIIYAGGVMGLLQAAVMSCRYHRRVMVFDESISGEEHRGWNVSHDELKEFERAGLLTKDEIASAVVNRYRSGFVKFHDITSRIKTPPLWMEGVMDVAIEADKLLALAARKLQQSNAKSALMEGLRFVRCYVEPSRVLVEVEETRTGRRKLFGARLFVDASGPNSPLSRQLNDGQSITHVRPTVGTVARGFVRGKEPHQADFTVGEILVSNEDASNHRQLMWEGFAGSPQRDEYTTYLFFSDAVNSPADKSLLSLFERYFETLPTYKRAGAQWRVLKPLFGYMSGFQQRGWNARPRTADDRVLLTGDAAGISSPLTFCKPGLHVRSLRRLTHLTELALEADLLDASSLALLNSCEPRVAQMASLAELLRPAPKSAPPVVNETMNAVMAALHDLDEGVRRDFFQDRMSLNAIKNLLSRTLKLYPRIFHRVREHLGARGTFWWLVNLAESMLHEQRRKTTAAPAGDAPHDEDAAQKFARQLALYQNNHHADEP